MLFSRTFFCSQRDLPAHRGEGAVHCGGVDNTALRQVDRGMSDFEDYSKHRCRQGNIGIAQDPSHRLHKILQGDYHRIPHHDTFSSLETVHRTLGRDDNSLLFTKRLKYLCIGNDKIFVHATNVKIHVKTSRC
jgi:hypothetical protein